MRITLMNVLLYGAMGLLLVLALTACTEPIKPVEVKKANNYEVTLLFENEGCKVYRFEDGGRDRYYTNCSETISSYSYHSGKSTITVDENIKTDR